MCGVLAVNNAIQADVIPMMADANGSLPEDFSAQAHAKAKCTTTSDQLFIDNFHVDELGVLLQCARKNCSVPELTLGDVLVGHDQEVTRLVPGADFAHFARNTELHDCAVLQHTATGHYIAAVKVQNVWYALDSMHSDEATLMSHPRVAAHTWAVYAPVTIDPVTLGLRSPPLSRVRAQALLRTPQPQPQPAEVQPHPQPHPQPQPQPQPQPGTQVEPDGPRLILDLDRSKKSSQWLSDCYGGATCIQAFQVRGRHLRD